MSHHTSFIGDVVNQAVSSLFDTKGAEQKARMSPGELQAQKKDSFKHMVDEMQRDFMAHAGNPDEPIEFEQDAYHLEEISDLEVYEKLGKLPASIASPSHANIIKIQKVLLLFNPASGAHLGVKIAKRATELLEAKNVKVVSIQLEKRGHAEEILIDYDLTGYDVVACLGGDGTFHEAVNGMMKRKETAIKVPLAFVAGGTGNSFSLELQGGVQVERAVKHILRGLNCPIDVGQVTFPRENGDEEIVYSFNSMHWGLASKVNVTAEKLRWMGKAIRYTTAAFMELVKGDQTPAKIVLEKPDGTLETYEEPFCLVIANNIVSAAKGMKMAPFAKLNDGLFDLLLIRSNKTLDLMQVFRKVYDGTHILQKEVEYRQVRSFSIIPYKKENPHQMQHEGNPEIAEELVDIDGELKGATPFFCKILPRAIRVIV